MLKTFLAGKIHRATITDANLNYVGSITIDSELMAASDILEHEKVQVVDINNGNRFETYVIKGKPHSGIICINGAASRLVQPGDKVIIISYVTMQIELAKFHIPKVVLVNQQNRIVQAGQVEETVR
jgi:aspartate 1-decarboxylase